MKKFTLKIGFNWLNTTLLATALLLSSAAFSAQSMVKNAAVETTLGLRLNLLSAQIDARVGQMKLISKSLANDTHIHAWVEGGFDASQESVLVEKLTFFVQEYDLTSASFADKNTHKYWNHEGFLRQLTPEVDTWYYAYLASGSQDLISVYHDQNKQRVDLYVNYQQTSGRGLSGIATSFDGVLNKLNDSVFAEHGTVYLVDADGKIHMQSNRRVTVKSQSLQKTAQKNDGENTLQALFNKRNVASLLQSTDVPSAQVISLGGNDEAPQTLIASSYMPSMGWFLVAHVAEDAF